MKDTTNKTGKQSTEWEMICVNSVFSKGLIFSTIQYQKITQLKMQRGPELTFLQRRHTDGQEAHEKLLNITNY